MNNKNLPDKKAREKIKTDLDKNFLVEAGAGSGKTTSLVSRMLALVKNGIYKADEIIAITFTRKAAAELKERFRTELEKEFKKSNEKEVKINIQKAIEDIDQVFTGTIHSFCAKLLRERPVEAGLAPDFQELDEIEEKILQNESWQEYLQYKRENDPETLKKLDELGISPVDLKESFMKVSMYPEIDVVTKEVKKPDLKPALKRIKEFIEGTLPYIPEKEPEKGYDSLQSTILSVNRQLRYLDLKEDSNLINIISSFDKSNNVTLYKWSDKDKAREIRDEKKVELKENYITPTITKWREYTHYYIYSFINPAVDFYQEKRLRNELVNFQDLLLKTARMLRDEPSVRSYFQNKYKTLLVDEFQDTDPIQAEIILYLTSKDVREKKWYQVTPKSGSLFVVGDPKQSIYRFRRADIDIYQMVKNIIGNNNGEILKLTSNFRSLNSISNYLNPVFKELLPKKDNKYQAQYVPLNTVHENDGANGVKLLNIPDDFSKKDEVVEKDAEYIAKIIKAALNGNMQIKRTENESIEDPKPNDFMILLRYKDNMDTYAQALENLGIPTIMTGNSSIDTSIEVKELYKLLSFLNDVNNQLLLTAILKGLFFGISDQQLYDFKSNEGTLSIFAPVPDDIDSKVKTKFENAFQTLKKYYNWINKYSPAVVLEKIIFDLGLLPFSTIGEMSDSRISNLYYLIERINNVEAERQFNFQNMINEFKVILDNSPEQELNIDPDKKGVRIMNLHKAKGLQASIVFLAHPKKDVNIEPDYHIKRSKGEEKGYFKFTKKLNYHSQTLGQPVNWDQYMQEENKYQEAEEKRLLYVAATRAKNMLIISNSLKSDKRNPWKELLINKKELEIMDIPEVTYQNKSKDKLKVDKKDFDKKSKEQNKWISNFKKPCLINISSDDLKNKEKIFEVERKAGGSQAWGTFVHLILEKLVNDKKVTNSFIERNLKKYDLELDNKKKAKEIIKEFKKSKLWERIITSNKVLTEISFKIEVDNEDDIYEFIKSNTKEETFKGDPDNIIVTGIIDLAFKEDNLWVIVDYKTDVLVDHSQIQKLKEAYKPQLELYKKVWEKLNNTKVKEKEIEFIQ